MASRTSLAAASLLPFAFCHLPFDLLFVLPFRFMPQNSPQNLKPGKHASLEIPGNFANTYAVLVRNGNLLNPQPVPNSLDLHLYRPPVIAILHLEPPQRI